MFSEAVKLFFLIPKQLGSLQRKLGNFVLFSGVRGGHRVGGRGSV